MSTRRPNDATFCWRSCDTDRDVVSKALAEANRQNIFLLSTLRAIAAMPETSAGEAQKLARDILSRL